MIHKRIGSWIGQRKRQKKVFEHGSSTTQTENGREQAHAQHCQRGTRFMIGRNWLVETSEVDGEYEMRRKKLKFL